MSKDANLALSYPVWSPDNRLLVPAGTPITEAIVEEVVQQGKKAAFPSRALLAHGSVRDDLLGFLREPPYDFIFAEHDPKRAEVFRLIGDLNLVLPVLEILDHFRAHDFHTYRHLLLVFALSTLLSVDLVPESKQRTKEPAGAGPTHDLGKICVPRTLLHKSVPLTRSERALLQHHTLAGHLLLAYYFGKHDHLAARIARDHHERLNGIGYPRGIQSLDPMVEIVVVCDVYDALVSSRPYRPVSFDNRTALEEITALAERGEVGWNVARALIACNRRGKPHYDELQPSTEKRGVPPAGNVYGATAKDGEDGSEAKGEGSNGGNE